MLSMGSSGRSADGVHLLNTIPCYPFLTHVAATVVRPAFRTTKFSVAAFDIRQGEVVAIRD